MYCDWNIHLLSIFLVVLLCGVSQCYMNIHERHYLYFRMIYFCEFQPATEMDQLQLIFYKYLKLKINQDIIFYVIWLKYILNIYIFLLLCGVSQSYVIQVIWTFMRDIFVINILGWLILWFLGELLLYIDWAMPVWHMGPCP